MYYEFRLKADEDFQAPIGGKIIVVDSTGAADGVDITPMRGGQGKRIPNRQKAFKAVVDFDTIVLRAPVACVVGLFLSHTDVSLGFADGLLVNVAGDVTVSNDAGNPVPVGIVGGVTLDASNVGISNDNGAAVPVKSQALSTIVDLEPVIIPGVAVVQLVSDPTLRRLRIRNSHASAVVAIGGNSVSLSKCPIRLLPGDVFLEDDAAGAQWYAITDTPGATVQIQGLK